MEEISPVTYNYTEATEQFLQNLKQLTITEPGSPNRTVGDDKILKEEPSGFREMLDSTMIAYDQSLLGGADVPAWVHSIKKDIVKWPSSEEERENPVNYFYKTIIPTLKAHQNELPNTIKLIELDENISEKVQEEIQAQKNEKLEKDKADLDEEYKTNKKNSFKSDNKKEKNDYSNVKSERATQIEGLNKEIDDLRRQRQQIQEERHEVQNPSQKTNVPSERNSFVHALNKGAGAIGRTIGSSIGAAGAFKRTVSNALDKTLNEIPKAERPKTETSEAPKAKAGGNSNEKFIEQCFSESSREHDSIDNLRNKAREAAENKDPENFNKYYKLMHETLSSRKELDQQNIHDFDHEKIGEDKLKNLSNRYENHEKANKSLEDIATENGLEFDKTISNRAKEEIKDMVQRLKEAIKVMVEKLSQTFKNAKENTISNTPGNP